MEEIVDGVIYGIIKKTVKKKGLTYIKTIKVNLPSVLCNMICKYIGFMILPKKNHTWWLEPEPFSSTRFQTNPNLSICSKYSEWKFDDSKWTKLAINPLNIRSPLVTYCRNAVKIYNQGIYNHESNIWCIEKTCSTVKINLGFTSAVTYHPDGYVLYYAKNVLEFINLNNPVKESKSFNAKKNISGPVSCIALLSDTLMLRWINNNWDNLNHLEVVDLPSGDVIYTSELPENNVCDMCLYKNQIAILSINKKRGNVVNLYPYLI
jgi:hypothetical protein